MGKKILVVEDDSDWRLVIGTALRDAGHEVIGVANAAEALLQKNDAGLGLIVLDLDLGGENGLMLMQHLKRNHPAAPIILFTGIEHDERVIEEMLKHGARRYVRKGAIADLLAAVEDALGPGRDNPQ